MRFICLLIISVVATTATAQYSFPKNLSPMTDGFDQAGSVLAKQLLRDCRLTDTISYLDDMLKLHFRAGQYDSTIFYLDSLVVVVDRLYPGEGRTVGLQYRVVAEAKLNSNTGQKTLPGKMDEILKREFAGFNDYQQAIAPSYIVADTTAVGDAWRKSFSKVSGTDSVGFEDARDFLINYNRYQFSRQLNPLANNFMAYQDNVKYQISDSLRIRIPGGHTVSGIIVRPRKVKGKLPAVLMYSIYAGADDRSRAKRAADNGYAGIIINTRGKFLSTDSIEPFEHDGKDAWFIIDWISKQKWSSGKVGMYGGSYLGFSQWSAVRKLHPALKTIVPQVAVGIGIDYPSHGGVFMTYMLKWIHYVTNNRSTDYNEFGDSKRWNDLFNEWYRSGRSFRALDTIDHRPNRIFQRWLDHPTHDSYWKAMVPAGRDFSAVNIPVLTTTGYFDDDQRGAFYYLQEHYRHNPNANHYLLIGPYNHDGGQSRAILDVKGFRIDSVASIDINETVFQWFDYILKDSVRPARLKDRFNFQVSGMNEWRSVPTMDALANDSMDLYFSNVRGRENYQLTGTRPATPGEVVQEIDLGDKSVINERDYLLVDSVLDRSGGIVFESRPLTSDKIMNGSFTGVIKLVTNKKDVDVLVKVYEYTSDHKYIALSYFLSRASLTRDRSARQLLTPGEPVEIPVNNSFFMSRKISKGSTIVVVLSVNNSPSWQVNYGSGKDVSDETTADAGEPMQIRWSNQGYIRIPLLRK